MADFEFDPPTGLLDTSAYPDVPASPTAARQQFMDLFYQARDVIRTNTNQIGNLTHSIGYTTDLYPRIAPEVNDTGRITRTLNAVSANGGGKVIFPEGLFLSDTFTVPSNVTLSGHGIKTELRFIRPTENHFIAVRGQNVIIEKMYINGNRTGRLTGGSDAVQGSTISIATDTPNVADALRTKHVKIQFCVLDTNGFDSIGMWDTDNVSILFNICKSGRDTSIDMVEGSYDIKVIGNYVRGGLFPIALDTNDTATYKAVMNVEIASNTIIVETGVTNGVSIETAKLVNVHHNTFHILGGLGTAVKVLVDAEVVDINHNTFQFHAGCSSTGGVEVNGQLSPTVDKKVNVESNILYSETNEGIGITLYYHAGKVRNNIIKKLDTGIVGDSGNNSLEYKLEDNDVDGCNFNIRLNGDYANKSKAYLRRNKSVNGVNYNYTVDNGYTLYYQDNPITSPFYYNAPVEKGEPKYMSNPATASTLGTLVKKMEVFDSQGNSIGFIPVYSSIT